MRHKIKVLLRKGVSEDGDPCTVIYASSDVYDVIGSIYNRDAKRLGLPHVTRLRDGYVHATIEINIPGDTSE